LIAHGEDRTGKAVVIPGGLGAALASDGQRIGLIAGKAVFGGD